MKTALITVVFLAALSPAVAQELVLLPSGLHLPPLRSSLPEPRIGLVKSIDAGEMRVDIGNSVDLIGWHSGQVELTAGIDFFTYALVTGTQGLRLQIDAVDGYFGGNASASYRCDSAGGRWSARLRLLHHSAHLVDAGAAVAIPYTQDLGELVVAYQPSGTLRAYGGVSYATLIRPDDIERFAYLAGVEAAHDGLIGPVGGQPLNLFVAYTAALNGTPVYGVTHTLQTGVKLGRFFEKGVSVFAEWYSGRHMLAEYYNRSMSFVGVGFAVDFF